jgi:hypothetical protein
MSKVCCSDSEFYINPLSSTNAFAFNWQTGTTKFQKNLSEVTSIFHVRLPFQGPKTLCSNGVQLKWYYT